MVWLPDGGKRFTMCIDGQNLTQCRLTDGQTDNRAGANFSSVGVLSKEVLTNNTPTQVS